MRLSNLIVDIEKYIFIGEDVDINNLSHNSKNCTSGTLYFAISGTTYNGKDYVEEAISNGAVAIITESKLDINIPQVIVDNVRKSMAYISKAFYGNACDKLKIIGIVGTNGKTTSSYILKHILEFGKHKVGVIGTNGVYIGNKYIEEELTTPDPINLHNYFLRMLKSKVEYVIMEVSAHAIDLYKIAGIKFDVGLYTNISNEHLDYFGTMENYANCKMKFFDELYINEAVINIDDDYGIKIARMNAVPSITYGIHNPANTFAVNIDMSLYGTKFVVNILDEIFDINTKLIGVHNVYNILGAISVCKILGVDNDVISNGISVLQKVDGRCNIIKRGSNYIVIDFAHTPDGFENILSTIKSFANGKVVTVFGCVGYSDSIKRSLMGEVASKYSDFVILTADNPNYAQVSSINNDIKKGFDKFESYIEIEDRVEAIKFGLGMLCKSDVLVLLGKGGERKQVINGEAIEYNELQIVNNLL